MISRGPLVRHADAVSADHERIAHTVHKLACRGLPEAQTAFGQLLLDGRGVAADLHAARSWFAAAASRGHAPAINMLGRCMELGWGGPIDLAAAAVAYRTAADAGLDWGQYNLANQLLRGRGVARDAVQALRLCLEAAATGHAKAMNLAARILEEGWAGPADPAQAAAWFRRAAELGEFRAQYNWGVLLVQSARLAEALPWLAAAAEAGTLDACRAGADALLARPEPELRRIGRRMAERCCEGGYAQDFHRYAIALLLDPAQPRQARRWLRRAASAGHAAAAAALEEL